MGDIEDIRRRAGILDEAHATDPNHINLSHAGRNAKAIIEKIGNLEIELEDEIFKIRKVNPDLGEELLDLYHAKDYVGLFNLIFRKF